EGAAADGEGAPTDGEAVEQGESAAADGETVGNEADAVDTDGTAPDADTDDTAPDADADQADSTDAHESAEADSEHAGADSDGAEETEGPDGSVDEGRDDLDETTAVEGSATPDGSDDHGADDADAESAQDEAAEPSDDESGSHDVTDEHDKQADGAQEAESIAVGVALTAPIESGYTPGEGHPEAVDEAGSTEAETDEAGSDAEQEASLTHEPGEAGSALGSFETAALTIPEQAPSISFDDLITGVPQMVRSDAEHVPDESETDAEDDAHAPTAATAIIRTPAADDEAAEQDVDQDAEPSTETTEIAGIEIFSALNEGRTQEIQVILDSADEEDDDLEDVTQGEIAHDEDPRAAAVSASLAAAARAFFSDDAPDYTPGPTEADEAGAHDDERSGSDSDTGEHVDGDHHDRGEDEHDHRQDQHGHDEHHG
ncbi:MAG: hypothetical protein JSS74_12555, partial [Actinobacteria bacterium]|nr:hypothetical protein [Actinomycetota bacterium]